MTKLKTIKSALVLGLFLFAASVSFGQVGFGLKGGLNLTNLKVDDPEATYDSRAGYHAGVFLRAKFNKIAIQPEILFSTQSTEVTSTLADFTDSFTYLSIPVMCKFYVVSGLNIQAGPQFGFLLDGERTIDSRAGSLTQDIKDYYKSSDVSVSVGGGYDLPFGLSLDVRYNIGVQDINDVSNGEEAKSRVFMVSVGYNFNH